jgi:acetyl esterase/lipase
MSRSLKPAGRREGGPWHALPGVTLAVTLAALATAPALAQANGASVGPAATHSNVAYADVSPSQVLDIWVPETGEAPYPLVIFVHGGAFMMGDKSMDIAHIADVLEAGYAAAGVNYRLSGEALFPAAVQDVKAAVRFLRAHADEYGLDPEAFAAWGASAGGNLVSMVGATGDQQTSLDDPSLGNADISSAVDAVVAWFPPVDFLQMAGQFQEAYPAACEGEPPSADAPESPESKYLGAPIQDVPDLAAAANPITYLATATELPVFAIAAGDSDCLVPHQQSMLLHEALEAAGGEASLTIVPGAGHGDPHIAETVTADVLAMLEEVFAR